MGKARDLARLSPNSSGQLPDANLLALAANKLSGVIPDANAPSGSVIQVVEATAGPASYTNYGSYANFITGSITTTVPNSRILVLMNIPFYATGSSDWSVSAYIRLSENGGIVSSYEHPGPKSGNEFAQMIQAQYLSGTKSVGTYTYVGSIRGTSGSGTMTLARTTDGYGGFVRIMMMEIAP
jgi:hypothetical protein